MKGDPIIQNKATAAQREVVWTRAAQADLQAIYEFTIPLQGEEKAYELVESIRRKLMCFTSPLLEVLAL